jgi:lipoprotein-anchoring transpeptidase ErfK/SrfK
MRRVESAITVTLCLLVLLTLVSLPPLTGRNPLVVAASLDTIVRAFPSVSPSPSQVTRDSASRTGPTATAAPVTPLTRSVVAATFRATLSATLKATAVLSKPVTTLSTTVASSVALSSTATLTPSLPVSPMPSPTATHALSVTMVPTATLSAFPFNTHPDLPRYMYVDQGTQHLYVFEHGLLLRDIPCSTGLPNDDSYTPAWEGKVGYRVGTFFSFGTFADDAWYLYQSQGAILVHSLPYTVAEGVKVYQDRAALGVRPSSHGCVRIAPEDAVWLTQWDPEGTLMTVTDPYLERWQHK